MRVIKEYPAQSKTINVINEKNIYNIHCKYCKHNYLERSTSTIRGLYSILDGYKLREKPFLSLYKDLLEVVENRGELCPLRDRESPFFNKDTNNFVLQGLCKLLEPEDIVKKITFNLPVHYLVEAYYESQNYLFISVQIDETFYALPLPNTANNSELCFGADIETWRYSPEALYDIYWNTLFNLDGYSYIEDIEAIVESIEEEYKYYLEKPNACHWESIEELEEDSIYDYDNYEEAINEDTEEQEG